MFMRENRNTGERLETNFFNKTTIEHLHRYAFAIEFTKDKIVLDIACGEGYGSNLLSSNASFVYGVDIDKETIALAKQKYVKPNLQFSEGSTSKIPLENSSIDLVVSFETIEHHSEHEQMMLEIKRVLKPDGMLIISTPDKKYYSDERNYKNPFHVKELYEHEFKTILDNHFKYTKLFKQIYITGASFLIDIKNNEIPKFYSGNFSFFNIIKPPPYFLVAISSNNILPVVNDSVFGSAQNLIEYEKKNLEEQVKNSLDFRLGKYILKPLRYFKRIYKKLKW